MHNALEAINRIVDCAESCGGNGNPYSEYNGGGGNIQFCDDAHEVRDFLEHQDAYNKAVPDPRGHKYFNMDCCDGCQYLALDTKYKELEGRHVDLRASMKKLKHWRAVLETSVLAILALEFTLFIGLVLYARHLGSLLK